MLALPITLKSKSMERVCYRIICNYASKDCRKEEENLGNVDKLCQHTDFLPMCVMRSKFKNDFSLSGHARDLVRPIRSCVLMNN